MLPSLSGTDVLHVLFSQSRKDNIDAESDTSVMEIDGRSVNLVKAYAVRSHRSLGSVCWEGLEPNLRLQPRFNAQNIVAIQSREDRVSAIVATCPDRGIFVWRFGSLANAYALIGEVGRSPHIRQGRQKSKHLNQPILDALLHFFAVCRRMSDQ